MTEEALGGSPAPVRLRQDVNDGSVVIDRTP